VAYIFATWAFVSVGCVYGIAAPEEEWNRTFGGDYWDGARSVQQTTDGAAAEDLADNNLAPVFSEDLAKGALSALDGWLGDIRVTTNSAGSEYPTIAVDYTNNVHITWYDSRDGNWEIYYTKLDNSGTTLVDDTRITTNSAGSGFPAIMVDSTNKVHITWCDYRNGNWDIYYTKLDNSGTTLVDDIRITTASADSWYPVIAVDTTNNVHIAWADNRDGNYEIYYTKLDNSGTTLVDDIRLTTDFADSYEPAIAVDSTNNVHITWYDNRDGNWGIYYTKLDNSGTTLVDDTRLTTASADSRYPAIAVDYKNNVHITWMDYRDGNWEIYYTKLDNSGTTLVDDTRLTTASVAAWGPAIAVDSTNNVHITWMDYRNWNWEIYYKNNCGGAPPENQLPTAIIDSITPNPAKQGKDTVLFIGHGNDSDGSIVAHNWSSSIDGLLNMAPLFTKTASELSVGTHTIYFTVQDDEGAWSSAATKNLTIVTNQLPVAAFSYSPMNPSMNETVTFNASASYDPDGSIISYIWTFGDGNVTNTSEVVITHSYSSVGNYTVNLTVTDDEGATNTTSREIQVCLKPPIATFACSPPNPVVNETVTFNASESYDPNGVITTYQFEFGDGNSTEGEVITHVYSSVGTYIVNLTLTDNEGATNRTSQTMKVFSNISYFDTEPGTYPSISGTHNGTITMTHTVNVSTIYLYPCAGTGGHTEYARIWNASWDGAEAQWNGYVGDWQNLSFDPNFTLAAGETYNYTIRTGSYPQIHHTPELLMAKGWITCSSFVDVNGERRSNWIPAIKLMEPEERPSPTWSITWMSDLQMTATGADSIYPTLGLNGSTVHLAWVDQRDGGGNSEIYYNRSTNEGMTWQAADTRISNDPASSIKANFAVNGEMVHLFWRDDRDGNYEEYVTQSTDGGVSWGPETRLTNDTGYSGCPFPVINGDLINLFWRDDRSGTFKIYQKRSVDAGVNWSADMLLTPDGIMAEFPLPATAGAAIHLVWRDRRDGNAEIYYKRSLDGGLTWTDDIRLTNDMNESEHPKIVAQGETLHVVWRDNRDGNYEVYYKRSTDGGESWSSDVRLTNDPGQSLWPALAATPHFLHLLWCDDRNGTQALYYTVSTDQGTTWAEETSLSECVAPLNIMGAQPIAVSDTCIHVVFNDNRTGANEIYYKRGAISGPSYP
jgi:PKD repeat protein